MRIAFFQYELSHPGNAPHVGMCLLLDDLRRAGHEVDAALVRAGAIESLVEKVRGGRYEFVALDSIFTVPLVRRLKEACPDVPLLVGGTNALPLFLFSPADWAIVGPAREALPALVDALAAGEPLDDVPNLYLRREDGTIDRNAATRSWRLEAELVPFDPDLDWGYVGGERDVRANVRFPSVVPELGCAFGADSLQGAAYRGLPAHPRPRALDALVWTDSARKGIDPFLSDTRGCAFCSFRFQTHVTEPAADAVERTVRQIETLGARWGVREFSVQSEHPFRFLVPLVERIREGRLPVDRLLVRTFPIVLARNPELVTRGTSAAVEAGIELHLQQLGFENFVQTELDRLGKGIRVAENIRAARLLFELHEAAGGHAHLFGGHGFILFTPWTRPEDVVENIRVVREEAPFLADSLTTISRLCFYDPFNPIFRLAERDGLTVASSRDYGWDFRFADERTERMCRLAVALERTFAAAGEEPGPRLARAVLTAVAPMFTGGHAMANDPEEARAMFADAEARARENLMRDEQTWSFERGRTGPPIP